MAMQENFSRSIMLRQLCMLQSSSQACHTIQQHCCQQNLLIDCQLTARRQLSPNPADVEVEKSLQEKGIDGLYYLGCYVLQKLHNKHRTLKNWKTSESQQAISALTACKEESKTALESILETSNLLSHGRSWSPTRKALTTLESRTLFQRHLQTWSMSKVNHYS